MKPRTEIIFWGTTGVVTATVLGVGIMAWGWPDVLIFAVPFFGGPMLAGAIEWFTSDTRRRRRQARLERKRARLERRRHAVSAH